jgi:hypothetical protein
LTGVETVAITGIEADLKKKLAIKFTLFSDQPLKLYLDVYQRKIT